MMLLPSDVVLDRPRGMGWQGDLYPARITKPYVYRGKGYDTLTPDMFPVKPPPKPKPTPEEKERVRLLRIAARDRRAAKRKREIERARRKREAEQEEARFRRERERRLSLAQVDAGRRRAPVRTPAPPEGAKPADRLPRNLKPSPGWKPLTGADIDEILEEL